MDKNYIEISADDIILDFERQMLAGVNIPSLLPVNIINQNEQSSICFITTGYKTVAETNIQDIESLCIMLKSFVNSLIVSEQYLLVGGKHFLDTDMVFYNTDTKETKLVFGRNADKDCHYGDTGVIIEFMENLKKILDDRVQLQLLEHIIQNICHKNADIKRVSILIEETERKWYCRNLIPTLPFSGVVEPKYQM